MFPIKLTSLYKSECYFDCFVLSFGICCMLAFKCYIQICLRENINKTLATYTTSITCFNKPVYENIHLKNVCEHFQSCHGNDLESFKTQQKLGSEEIYT